MTIPTTSPTPVSRLIADDEDCPAPSAPFAGFALPLHTRDAIGAMRDEMHTMLTLAQYVASSLSVLEAINLRANRSREFAQTMGDVHPTWRDPDCHGETMGALAQLIGMAWTKVQTTCRAIEQQQRTLPPGGMA